MSVTIHDVAPATQAKCEQLIARVERVGRIPMTLLIVPRYHHQACTPAFERWIETRLRQGDELALHGLTHLDPKPATRSWIDRARRRWYTAGEGEFAALARNEAAARLDAGRRWFERRGWPLRGFVAPAWLLGAGAWAAVFAQPLDYTCTLTRLIALRAEGAMPKTLHGWSIVFSTRAVWRRHLSLAWNKGLAWREQQGKWMRFELHPFDVDHISVCNALERWLERGRAARREPLTLGGLIDRFR
ncbi:MAG TPA: polysaccharide deacetylase family protein [Burkholderiaceae bacterium]|nr:polysaccharide deacetylase family protein [Burkholderiaceae bacterium]